MEWIGKRAPSLPYQSNRRAEAVNGVVNSWFIPR